jgi:arylsulfatase A-like enzyme
MKEKDRCIWLRATAGILLLALFYLPPSHAQTKASLQNAPPAAGQKPNIILIVSDDFGYGDSGPYGGGVGRGMPTPNIDQMAAEGMTFYSFYAQASCTAGRAAMMTGRFPNRSGMTTVAFQGQGGGLPAAEWTLASVLKQAGYQTFFSGKWHLGESDYALPNAHGFDEMKYAMLYHLNAYTYADPKWFPSMNPDLRALFAKVTTGALSGNAGEKPHQEWRVNGEYENTPDKGWVGIPYLDEYIQNASIDYLERAAKTGQPFFMSINFMKVHQPNLPHPDYIGKSMSKSKYADSIVEADARIGHVMDKIRELGIDKNTLVVWTTDNGAWQDVYPDAGYTPFRGTKGTVREGGNRVPAIAWWPGKIKADTKNHDIIGGLDLMATFAAFAGVKLPENDLEGKPTIFDSYDMTPVLLGTGKDPRNIWFYFTEQDLTPGAIRVDNLKAVFDLRGDGGQATGGLAVDTNLGWKGPGKMIATAPQIFDLWQDPQERYDIFMNNYTESTWAAVTMMDAFKKVMATYLKYPPRKVQGLSIPYVSLGQYELLKSFQEQLGNEGFKFNIPVE